MDASPRRSAAEALLEHRAFVHALARQLAGEDDGADVAQEAALAGLTRPPGHARAWRSWLRATMSNLAANLLRTRRRTFAREQRSARSEAQPSTVDLVQRLELEQRVVAAVLSLPEPERSVVLLRFYDGQSTGAIAERIGAPADTVRARMRRALVRLRAELDREYGRRETWQRALLPFGLPFGATLMSAKGVAAAVAAGVVAAVAWFATPPFDSSGSDGPELARGAASPADASRANPPAAPTSASMTETTTPRAARTEQREDAVDPAAAAAALPPPGEVAFRFVDVETRLTLRSVRIRFLNETRFGTFNGDGGGESVAKLTAGRWSARATSAGFEPLELPEFEVREGAVTDLGTLELAHGGARIEGRVSARHAVDRSVTVELRGEGRAPCASCRAVLARCAVAKDADGDGFPDSGIERGDFTLGADCGFASELSRAQVADGGTFRFGDLAAGTYWLRAIDAGAELVDVKRVTVARDGSAWVDLDVSRRTRLVVELRDEGGRCFAGAWRQPDRESPAPIEFLITCGKSKAMGRASARPLVEDVRSTLGPPPLLSRPSTAEEEVAEQETLQLAELLETASAGHEAAAHVAYLEALPIVGALFQIDRLDRERAAEDSLIDPGEPTLPDAKLVAERERLDRYVLGPLPRELLTVVVRCGLFVSGEIATDLRYGFEGPLVIALLPVDGTGPGATDCPAAPSASCANCHAETQELPLLPAPGR